MSQPLAERLRPRTLDEYIGQKHLVGEGAVLRKMIDSGRVPSFILWGPPGVGKTTLAHIISQKLEAPFYTLSAINSGVKDVRDVIDKAKSNRSAGFVVECGRDRCGDFDWCDDRESFVRSYPSAPLALPSLCSQAVR